MYSASNIWYLIGKFPIFNKKQLAMKNYPILRLFLSIVLLQSCQQDDYLDAPDPNLFLGSWKLSSSVIEGVDSMEMSDCTKNSLLLLYRFSENNSTSNAELYDYGLNDMGECIVMQSINQATWASLRSISNQGDETLETTLQYITEQGETVNLTLESEGELLKVSGNMVIEDSDITINRTYRRLGQEFP